MIEFTNNVKIKPTYYSILHDTNPHYPRHWNFEASNDCDTWHILKQHKNDTSINRSRQPFSWQILNCNESFKMFRIHITGKNAFGNYRIMCHGFEIYGHLTRE